MEYDREEARKRAARKRAAEKQRKMRRRRLMILGTVALIVLLTVICTVLLIMRTGKNGRQVSPEVVATASPTASPSVELTPIPTMPPLSIQADWYRERTEELYRNLTTYGNYKDEAEVYAALEQMQIDPNGKKLALTFDDGPYSPITEQILDVLEENHARATFFVRGSYIDYNKELIQRELGLGCEIGNHTTEHEDLEKLSPAERRATVGALNDKMYQLFDYRVHLLRPPYISYGKNDDDTRNDIVAMAKEYELAIVNHTRSSHDSHEDYTAQMMIDRVLAEKDELGRGLNNSILLFHDKYQKTVEALKVIIPALQQQGYQLVTVSELLNCSNEGLHYGWIYSKAD